MKRLLLAAFIAAFSIAAQAQTHTIPTLDRANTYSAEQVVSISNAPLVFTPFTHVNGFSSIIGAGPHNGGANTPAGWYQTMNGASAVGTEAGLFAISIPSNYTAPVSAGNVVDALGFYAWTQKAGYNAVGLSGQMVCDATGAFCWGANPQVMAYGANGATGMELHGVETDCVNLTTGTIIYCNQVGGPGSTTNPSTAIAYDVSKPSWPSGKWDAAYQAETGSATYALYSNPAASGNTQAAMPIGFQATKSDGTTLVAQVLEDASGNVAITPGTGGFLRNSLAGSGFQLLSSGGNFTQLTNTASGFRSIVLPDSSGTVGLVIASGTSTFTTTAVGAGACQTTVTTAATNALTSDTISWAYASAPTAATDGMLHIQPYVTAGNVNFMRCNPTAGSITPTALVINWRVIR